MERDSKARRKELLRQLKHKQRSEGIAELPADRDELQALFDMLDRELPRQGCDHTLRLTRGFVTEHGLPMEAVVQWLGKYSGFCDCEVLANVEQHFRELLR